MEDSLLLLITHVHVQACIYVCTFHVCVDECVCAVPLLIEVRGQALMLFLRMPLISIFEMWSLTGLEISKLARLARK